MAYGCCRITQENEQLKDRNKNLELEVAGMKAVSDEHVKRIKALQEENATYVARIATLEERIRQDKEKLNLHCKILRDLVNEWDQEESVRCQVFQHYARLTISISFKRWWQETGRNF